MKKLSIRHNVLDSFIKPGYSILHKSSAINQAEMPVELPGSNVNIRPEDKTNFGQITDVLEKDVQNTENKLQAKLTPSPDELKDWALRWSVLQYYKNMNIDPSYEVTKTEGADKTIRQMAPSKEIIYKLWLDKLLELNRRKDKFKLNDDQLNEATDKGIPQGGAFEKRLERYREDFMNMTNFK